MEIFNHNSNINFLGMRKYSIAIAVLLMIASIALIATKGLNYGLDFTGGVSLEVDYDQPGADRPMCARRWPRVASRIPWCRALAVRVKCRSACSPRTIRTRSPAGRRQGQSRSHSADVIKMLQVTASGREGQEPLLRHCEVGAELRSDGVGRGVRDARHHGFYLWIRFERRFAIAALATESTTCW
jgi:preprotein translocase subunit SecF